MESPFGLRCLFCDVIMEVGAYDCNSLMDNVIFWRIEEQEYK